MKIKIALFVTAMCIPILAHAAAHGVLFGTEKQTTGVSAVGTSGQVLTSNGDDSDPSFQTITSSFSVDCTTTGFLQKSVSGTGTCAGITLSDNGILNDTILGPANGGTGVDGSVNGLGNWFSSPDSVNLKTLLSDELDPAGTGLLLFSPGGLNVSTGKTLAATQSITLTGTDSTVMTFPTTSATIARTDAAQTFTGMQTISGGTITTSQPAISATQTWNAGGVTFTGQKINVTNTASATASRLTDVQVAGTSAYSTTVPGVNALVPGSTSTRSGMHFNYGVDELVISADNQFHSSISSAYALNLIAGDRGVGIGGPPTGTPPSVSDPNGLNLSRMTVWFGRHGCSTVAGPPPTQGPCQIKIDQQINDDNVNELQIIGNAADSAGTTHIIGGDVSVTGGAGASASASAANGGNIVLTGGAGYGTGVKGNVRVSGHAEYTGTAPTLSSCGGGSPSVVGNSNTGAVTIGTGTVASCTVTFATAWTNAPHCWVHDSSTMQLIKGSATTTVLTITVATDMHGDVIQYGCMGHY